MIRPSVSPEDDHIQAIAQDFESRGYSVVRRPTGADLPGFLDGYRPDLIAVGPTENVVVEIKSFASTADADRFRGVADRVARQPGWRFVLVAPPPREGVLPGEQLTSFDASEIRQRLEEAHALQASGHPEAALLLAWAAAEAALRLLAERESIPLRRPDTGTLLRELASEGVVDRDHFRQLSDSWRQRSAVAHGFRPQAASRPEEMRDALKRLTDVTSELLEEERTSA